MGRTYIEDKGDGMNYYNDNDPYVAKWLRNLIAAGHLPQGDVDERSILEVTPNDVRGYEQCHFFAGIGGWPLALEWAGWRGPVWSGSCPCQPLSSAGQRKGDADERRLWPAFQQLIAECGPPVVFGEQVASKDGREWLSAVRTDLESMGYACGAADLSAAGVGAPHIRQRLFWVAHAASKRCIRSRVVSDIDGTQRTGRKASIGSEHWKYAEIRQENGTISREWQPQPEPFSDAYGLPQQLGQLRAYGNSIVPELAAEFVRAFMETNNA